MVFSFGCIGLAESDEGRQKPSQDIVTSTPQKEEVGSAKLVGMSRLRSAEWPIGPAIDTPELCSGHGELNLISVTDWEAGLSTWTAGTHDIGNSDTFDTPDWEVVTNLPDGRAGQAVFVADLDSGDCLIDDESGALNLDSAPILIPGGTVVPRISVNHWFATEADYDGGNIKINVNGAGFELIRKSAIDFNPYNGTLVSVANGNTNPLAGEDVFTGFNDYQRGDWGQSRISLYGIAEAGDTIQLRFDFGVDCRDGLIGWYVDEVEIYSCSAELPPSDCGNEILDVGELCDDGNTFIDDGCSNTCQIEEGWECTSPAPPGEIADNGFEAGTPNPSWTEASTNFGSPICNQESCGIDTGTGPADGSFWAWFGGAKVYEEGTLSQSVIIPSTASELTFEFEASLCDSSSDYFEVLIDGTQELVINGSSTLCGKVGYSTQSVDIGAYADGAPHTIEFHSESFANNLDRTNFFMDDIRIPGKVSICTPLAQGTIFADGFESK